MLNTHEASTTVSNPTDDVPQLSDIQIQIQQANEKVDDKTVIVDKLGKIWRVLEIINSIGEPLKDVSSQAILK